MNSFNVITPDEWKENLYSKTTHKKAFKIRPLAVLAAAVAVIIGHSKSCFLNFQGGKSVASGVGTILALNFTVGVIIAVIWAIITYFTKYVLSSPFPCNRINGYPLPFSQ